jgi:cytidylate kinase
MSVITISRQFGAGGKTLGKRVAERLGFYYADEDIIERAAVEVNVSPDWKNIIEVEPGGKLQRYISKLNPFGQSLMERPLRDKQREIDGFKYVQLLHTIITQIAEEGNAVIVGRGGQFILRDFDDAFHIFLIADYEYREKFIADKYPFSHKKAAQVVERMEQRRTNLYSYFGREDYDDLTIYDLTLNISMLSLDKAEELICKLVTESESK